MADGRWTKRLIEWRPRVDKHSQGRPPTRWTDDLKRITTNWIATAKNRENWRCLEEAYAQLRTTLLSEESFTEMEKELEKIRWDIVGMSEVRRRGESLETLKSGHLFYYNGEQQQSIGVSTRGIYAIFKINTRYNLKVVQVYAPTTEHTDEEIETFYDDLCTAISNNHTHFTVVCSDFNAKLGTKLDPSETPLGNFGSPGRNDRGDILLNFLLEKNLFQMNSFFHKKPHCRWTWKSPDGRTKNEIDYFITDKRYIFSDVTVLKNLQNQVTIEW
ncbi:craniofacial development protein 2-like [Sitophilus oryzae]|uniref:Craniofacial development protein 2-like n=1 Tax=Sitophilus oryzae TaxID=7048 RepID=A0A6J2X8V6_SITOR|nr:craniofacial development protein 2-like [Sitophilus oryzae]